MRLVAVEGVVFEMAGLSAAADSSGAMCDEGLAGCRVKQSRGSGCYATAACGCSGTAVQPHVVLRVVPACVNQGWGCCLKHLAGCWLHCRSGCCACCGLVVYQQQQQHCWWLQQLFVFKMTSLPQVAHTWRRSLHSA